MGVSREIQDGGLQIGSRLDRHEMLTDVFHVHLLSSTNENMARRHMMWRNEDGGVET